MLSNKADKESITNAMSKKVNKTELSTLEKEFTDKLEQVEDSFKSKLEQVLEAQEKFIKIVENESLFNSSKVNRHNPQLEDLRKQINTKLDRREIETYNQEYINDMERLKDEVEDMCHKVSADIECCRSNSGNF